jgi:hypothetical protein
MSEKTITCPRCERLNYIAPTGVKITCQCGATIQKIYPAEDFEPFGPEWEREMMKLPKKIIIEMLKNKCNKEKP